MPKTPGLLKVISMNYTFLFIISFIGAITPGPDILLVINNTLKYGIFSGLVALSGIATGWLVFLSIIYFGLAYIFSTPLAQFCLSLFGGFYLFYIAFLLVKSKQEKVIESNLDSKDSSNIFGFYIRGFMVNISNPKAILFFSVIIAPYMQSGDILSSLVVLFLSLSSGFLSVIIICAFFRKFINDRIFFIIDKICSVIFAVFGICLFYNAYKLGIL